MCLSYWQSSALINTEFCEVISGVGRGMNKRPLSTPNSFNLLSLLVKLPKIAKV